MTVNKLDLPSKENAVQEKINEIIDNLSNKATLDENNTFTGDNEFTGWRFAALDPNGAGLEISSDIYLSTPYNKIYIESQDNNYDNSGGELWLSADNLVNVTSASFTYNNSQVATVADIGNGTITINQGGSPKGTFTVNQSGNTTIDLDAGGSTPTNMVTTDTAQNITGVKTFVGQKMIGFKQSTSSNKLGFTLYNNNNVEKGYLEFNPSNTVDSVPLMTLGNYATAAAGLTHVGFRKYSSISGASGAYNLLAPLISDAKTPFNLTTTYTNFYLPLGFTNGTNTVLTAKSGLVDISTLLPTVPTVGNGTITLTQGGVTKGTFTVNQSGNSTIDLDAGGGGTIDQTFDGTSTNAQSGVAINGKLQSYQQKLIAGDNITFSYGSDNWSVASQKANLSSQDETLNITYGNGILVSVDRYGHSCRSTDNGNSWSTPIQFSSEEWFGSCYGDGKFVSISDTGYLYISTDGGLTYNNGEYVGVLHTNIAYGNGLFIALTYNGYIAKATDLSNWSAQTYNSDLGARDWGKPIYDGTKFITLSPQGYMATTTDGENYAVSTTDLDTNFTWYAFGYNGSQYIVIGTNGEIATSTNCVNWTTPTYIINLGNHNWQDVAYDGIKLIAIGSYGYLSESESGQTISANFSADQTFNGNSINAQSGVAIQGKLQSFQPLLTAGDNITLQSGGSTWTNAIQISNLSSQTWWACCYDGTKFIAISIYGYVSTSVDGQTWTLAEQDSNLGDYNWWTYVTYGGGILVAIGYEGYVSSSIDGGITWSAPSQDLGNRYWNGIAYDGTKFVVVGEQGYVSTSTDGINWSEPEYKSELGQINWDSLAYGSDRLVALSASGYRSTSTDGGETWSSPQSIGRSNWYDILYDGNNFVALSNDGYIAKSADGINWTTPEYISELGNHAWTTLGYNGNKLIVLGDYGYYSEALTSTVISAESEIFVAEYDVTSYSDVLTAYNNGKIIYCSVNNAIYNLSNYYNNTFEFKAIVYSGYEAFKLFSLNSNGWSNVNGYEIADTDLSNLSATGKTVLDGQWVSLNQVIYSSQSLTNSTSTDLLKTVNVPNDGQIYEVAFKAQVTTGSTSGNNIALNIKGNVLTDVYYVCSCQTRSNSSVQASGFVSIPLKYASDNLATLRNSSYSGTATLAAIAYRRIGSNT